MVSTHTYDRGEHRTKHCWNKDHADFVTIGTALIGKCASSVTDEIATQLLNDAIPEPDPFGGCGTHPARYYNVYQGVIYEAAPTEPGVSYHGYPWRGRPGRPPLPRQIVAVLRARAAGAGYGKEFKKWLKNNS
ncbi:MAG: hypothetical protein CO108_21995 [Deltaproteobacteria bacterium CG_4_9_14_3_um_filter_63_12]|nr:MAG: hypothetical protein CO108_21995 [Deltaproteobacteria bacterium CG_4_9_14_3_um_filter_63_12]